MQWNSLLTAMPNPKPSYLPRFQSQAISLTLADGAMLFYRVGRIDDASFRSGVVFNVKAFPALADRPGDSLLIRFFGGASIEIIGYDLAAITDALQEDKGFALVEYGADGVTNRTPGEPYVVAIQVNRPPR